MEGERHRGRCYLSSLDGVREACDASSLKLRDAKVKCVDREQWRSFLNGTNGGMILKSMTEPTFDARCWIVLNRPLVMVGSRS